MDKNIFTRLHNLHMKSMELVHDFAGLPDKDIKRKHIELLSSQIATSLISLKVCFRFTETNKDEFEQLLNNDPQLIDNYIFVFKQSLIEAIMDTALFQTELVLRIFYSKIANVNPAQERSINRIIATLFDDIENNWQKEEAKLLVLFWTMRNTIHTGGIYFKNPAGYSLSYKGKEYKFEFMKSFQFLEDIHIIDLISDFLDCLSNLFKSQKIQDLGYIEHPSYFALGHN